LNLKTFPIGSFGAVMGLVGLGLTARAAAPLFPGVFRAPAYFTELWAGLGMIAFLFLSFAYLGKILVNPDGAKQEFLNPGTLGFCGTLPVGMSLVAGGLAPYAPLLASELWWASVVLFAAFFAWGAWRLLAGSGLKDVYPAMLVLFVGGIVFPSSGIALGNLGATRVLFAVSAIAAVPLYAALLMRAFKGPALPEPLRPTWVILLVPPSLIGAHGAALFPEAAMLAYLYLAALAVLAGVLWYARGLPRWPFSPVWWSLTFPLDALAYAAGRYAQANPSVPVWRFAAGATLLLATAVVSWVLLRSLIAVFARPRSAASPAA
jgi:tellurite resistance protein